MRAIELSDLATAQSAVAPLAYRLFDELNRRTSDPPGVTRDSYGRGEQEAHDIVEGEARSLGLEVTKDPAGNLYMTLPGENRALPGWYVGSHLDSVLHGGNYDGAAGVVAGLTAAAVLQRLQVRLGRDLTVMGVRAEECSTWFVGHHGGHLGSRAALGLLWPGELDSAIHVNSKRTLAESIDAAGFDSAYFRRGVGSPYLSDKRVAAYFELHIEQGPILHHRQLPVGVVTGIRGALRARNAKTLGAYTHSGAVPHELRQDAVLATVAFTHMIDRKWEAMRASGKDMVYTVGKFYTDSAHHSIVKVPGEVNFALDIRSQERNVLDEMQAFVARTAADIGEQRNVSIDLGPMSLVTPAVMDEATRLLMKRGCTELGIAYMDIASGAGHDAADFHDAGIPSAMIFVRNDHGSHNPHEAMDMSDFLLGTRLLTWTLANMP